MSKWVRLRARGLTLASVCSMFVVAAIAGSVVYAAPPTIDLGEAESFAILAGTPNITDAGNSSVINGNVGLSPASGAGIGLECSQVMGVIYSVDAAGPLGCRVTDGPRLVTAKNNLTAAYDDAASRTTTASLSTELGGTTVVAGIYDSASTTFEITADAGPLVLDGQGDPSSVFIFKAGFDGTGLTVGSGSEIELVNGAQACNVFWQVNTATIDTTADFTGTVMALNSITAANGATIEGRLLARNGNVTLDNNTITVPACAPVTDDEDPEENPSQTPGGSGDATGVTPGQSGSATNTTVPGFPNTGTFAGSNFGWMIAAVSSAVVGLYLVVIARKKYSN